MQAIVVTSHAGKQVFQWPRFHRPRVYKNWRFHGIFYQVPEKALKLEADKRADGRGTKHPGYWAHHGIMPISNWTHRLGLQKPNVKAYTKTWAPRYKLFELWSGSCRLGLYNDNRGVNGKETGIGKASTWWTVIIGKYTHVGPITEEKATW
jgi:hypothetical protein